MTITLKGAIGEVILAQMLTEAKEAHTRWEAQFTSQANPVPPHSWEDWYARFIVARLNEQEPTVHRQRTAPVPPPDDAREYGWIA
jgi:hypothetical protein